MSKIKSMSIAELEEKTVAELRELCKKYGIVGMSKARKDDIIDEISNFYDNYENFEDSLNITNEEPSKLPYINANLHSFLDVNDTYKTLISVSCGAASSNYPVVGKTVGYVKATYREILNIEIDSKAVTNGNEVSDSYILKSGDTLEFVRQAGVKG